MSRLSNLVSGNAGKGTIPAPTGNVPGNNAPDLSLVSSEVAELKNTVNDLAGMMATLLNKMANSQTPIVAPDKVAQPVAIAIEPANANDPATWTAERLEATRDREKDKDHMAESLTGIMVAIRDRLWPAKKGYPRSFVNIRNQDKANMIPVILEYKEAYLAGKVEQVDTVASEPASQNPGVILAWQKVAELQGQGFTANQIGKMLLVFNLPNVLGDVQPDPNKAIVLPTVKPETPDFLKAIRDPNIQATKYHNTAKHAATIRNLFETAEKDIAKHKKDKAYAKLRWSVYMEATKVIDGDYTDGCRTSKSSFSHYAALNNLEHPVWGGKPSAERHATAVAKQAELDKKAK